MTTPDHDPIVAPAIQLRSGQVISAPRYPTDDPRHDPTPIHGDAAIHAMAQGHPKGEVTLALMRPRGTGFVTRSGQYVSRRDAIAHARKHGQLQVSEPHLAKLQHQYDSGQEEVSLDSGDLVFAKALAAWRFALMQKSDASHYAQYDRRTNQKMAEHNREGGDVRKPVRKVEGASASDKRDRARFAYRKATQALKQNHPLEDDNGKPTPAAMQFKRWGFAAPKNREDLQRLKAFGAKHMQTDDDVEKSMNRFDLLKANIIMASPQLGKLGKLFDYESLGKENTPVTQGHIERVPITTSVAAKNYDQIVDQTTRTLRGSENRKLLDEGMKHHGHLWYHLDPLHNAFKERLGEEEGSRRFNLFARTVAATSPNSEFTQNMRRAGALMPFMVHGDSKKILTPDEGINHLMGVGTGNTAHRNYASALQATREGKASIFNRPLKADGFASNLQGNFSPLTADRHFLRQAGLTTGSGKAKQSASPTEYQAVEDATHHVAEGLARRGILPVADDRGATAPYQSALWIGDAVRGRVKSPPHPALAVFESEINTTANKLGIHPKEALNRFIDGTLHHFGGGAPGLDAHIRVQKALGGLLKSTAVAVAWDELEKAMRDIRLVPDRQSDDFSTYDVHDTASATPDVPSASVSVYRNRKGGKQLQINGEPNALGVRGLKAVASMVGKIHPDLKQFAGNRPKAAERLAFDEADFPKTQPWMTREERQEVYAATDQQIADVSGRAKASMKARGIPATQQIRRKNPFAKALALAGAASLTTTEVSA